MIEKKCIICGKIYKVCKSHAIRRKTCSKKCIAELYRRKPKEEHPCWNGGEVTKTCPVCKVKFTIPNAKRNQKTCSNSCAAKLRTKEPKIAICIYCKNEFIVPKKRPDQKFCSFECYRKSIKGNGSFHWKGGKTTENKRLRNSAKFKKWRKSVFERDNYTCQKCGASKTYIEPHHIKLFSKYPELRFSISNGITLCRYCHQLKHKHKLNNTKIDKSIG